MNRSGYFPIEKGLWMVREVLGNVSGWGERSKMRASLRYWTRVTACCAWKLRVCTRVGYTREKDAGETRRAGFIRRRRQAQLSSYTARVESDSQDTGLRNLHMPNGRVI